MIIKDNTIDGGKGFDWGKVSLEYAKYRDIYPQEFYQKILRLGLCRDGQKILDLGTGSGVLPRNLLLNNVQDDNCMGAGSDLVVYIV